MEIRTSRQFQELGTTGPEETTHPRSRLRVGELKYGVRIVLIEDASRLARQLVTQELAILALTARGVRVLTANGDDRSSIKSMLEGWPGRHPRGHRRDRRSMGLLYRSVVHFSGIALTLGI